MKIKVEIYSFISLQPLMISIQMLELNLDMYCSTAWKKILASRFMNFSTNFCGLNSGLRQFFRFLEVWTRLSEFCRKMQIYGDFNFKVINSNNTLSILGSGKNVNSKFHLFCFRSESDSRIKSWILFLARPYLSIEIHENLTDNTWTAVFSEFQNSIAHFCLKPARKAWTMQ